MSDSTSNPRLRIAAINFLNPAPLLYNFEHSPQREQLASRYAVSYTLPSACAAQLASGEADLGLIPIAAMATIPDLSAVPRCVIASLNEVRSIQLIVRHNNGIQAIRTLAADTASRSSIAYVQILLRKYYGIEPELIPSEADVETMLTIADAAIVIGDPALLAIENRTAIETSIGQPLLWIDVAAEWRARTGLPWVAAVWAVRNDAFGRTSTTPAQLIEDLQQSRDNGLANIDTIVQDWEPLLPLSSATLHHYLTENIHYTLDDDCAAAIELFYKLAAEYEILPAYHLSMLRQ